MIRDAMLQTARGPIHYLEAGTGWPCVLIHAFPLTCEMWQPQLDRVPEGWRLIAPDTRGLGRTPATTASSTPSIDDYAADVEAVLDALHIDAAVIGGLSMGGYIAFALYRRAPDRFTGMILADTRAEADTPAGREARESMSALVRAQGPPAVADNMLPKLLGSAGRDDDRLKAQVRGMIEGNSAEGLDHAILAMMGRPDSTPLLSHLAVPALVIVGSEDQLTPVANSETLAREIPRAQLVVVPGAGHLSSLEAPEPFSAALANFLISSM
jgi:pimeloyl-ACP methyl ester carboxylesterase